MNENTPRAGIAPAGDAAVLQVTNLSCRVETRAGPAHLVDGVSFRLARGRTLGIVGESGSGKTQLVRAIIGMSPPGAAVTGQMLFNGTDLQQLSRKQRRRVLGSGIGMVFQDPNTSLNPVLPIGRQITEGMRFNLGIGRREARERAADLLNQVGISDPRTRMRQYPHQLSGGMRQRVTIACALACDPEVLIADEVTTALDVTVQKQLLDLLGSLQQARGTAMLLISHDLGVVAGRTDDLAVMYLGQLVEIGPTREVFRRHMHRYTDALLAANPSLGDTPHAQLRTIAGTPPPLADLPPGCRFAPRCQAAVADCRTGIPELLPSENPAHVYRCFHPVLAGPAVVSGPRS